MKRSVRLVMVSFALVALTLGGVATGLAATRTVTIEGPVTVTTAETPDGQTVYWVEDPSEIRYRVVLPEPEQTRLAALLKREPTTVIRFNGTVVDNESGPVFNVQEWSTVTKTTTVTRDGQTKVIREKTTTIE